MRPEEAEPTLRDALGGPLKVAWLHSVLCEIITQFNQGSFRVGERAKFLEDHPGTNVMESGTRLLLKWAYSKEAGSYAPSRFKGRFLTGGDTQVQGVDYCHSSSPTPRPVNIRWMFSKSADLGWSCHSTDVSGAFCLSKTEFDNMAMECPRFLVHDDDGAAHPDGIPMMERRASNSVKDHQGVPLNYCKRWNPLAAASRSRSNARRRKANYSDYILHLQTQVYGTKQAPRQWYRLWSKSMDEWGYTRSLGDECLWYRRDEVSGSVLVVATHVDDSLCLTNSLEEYRKFVEEMKASFECTDEGETDTFLGIKITRSDNDMTVEMNQSHLVDAIVTEGAAVHLPGAETPLEDGTNLSSGGKWQQVDPTVTGGKSRPVDGTGTPTSCVGPAWLTMLVYELEEPEPAITMLEARAV